MTNAPAGSLKQTCPTKKNTEPIQQSVIGCYDNRIKYICVHRIFVLWTLSFSRYKLVFEFLLCQIENENIYNAEVDPTEVEAYRSGPRFTATSKMELFETFPK